LSSAWRRSSPAVTALTIFECRLGVHVKNRVHLPRRTHVRLPEVRAKLTWRVNSSIRFDAIRHTWNLGIARPSRWAVTQLRPMAVAGEQLGSHGSLRSLPRHPHAKLRQRDDRSLVLTFLDWALIPMVGLDVRCWPV